jgi:hypothetical protein
MSHRQLPLTTPYGKRPRKPNRPQILPTHFGQHEGHGPKQTLKKRKHSQTIYPFFSHIPLKINQERKKPLPFNYKFLTNPNRRSAGSIDQKFKPSSTTSNLKVLQATTSSRAKSFRNYLPLASNI